jgi:hypothetical protein
MPNGTTLMNPDNFIKQYNTCPKVIKTALYHCQTMFCQDDICTTNYTQPCHTYHVSHNLLPQYYTHTPIIQNPNQNQPHHINYDKPTPMPKHIYTKDIKETTRKDNHQTYKKKTNTYVNGYSQIMSHIPDGCYKINCFHTTKTITPITT